MDAIFIQKLSSVDAIFGAVKRSANDEALKRAFRNDIVDAEGLHKFLTTHINSSGDRSKIIPMIVTTEDYDNVRNNEVVKRRWDNSRTLDGTQQHHHFQRDPNDRDFIIMRPYSGCDEYKRVRLFKKQK